MLEGRNIKFRLIGENDAEFIVELRCDEFKNRYLSTVKNDVQTQVNWIKEYKFREEKGEEYYFVIEDKNGDRLGCLRLYDFRNDSFCWGSWIIKGGSPSWTAVESALLVYEYAFYKLGFNKSHFEVHKKNTKVVSFHTKFGAKIVSENDTFFFFNYSKEAYEEIRGKYTKYLPKHSTAV